MKWHFEMSLACAESGGVCFVSCCCCSWKDIVNKVNAQMDGAQVHGYPESLHLDPRPGQETQKDSSQPPGQKRAAEHQTADRGGEKEKTDNEELEMGMLSLIPCCTTLFCSGVPPDHCSDRTISASYRSWFNPVSGFSSLGQKGLISQVRFISWHETAENGR